MIRTNKRGEIVVPFFRVGVPEVDLAALLDALFQQRRRAA